MIKRLRKRLTFFSIVRKHTTQCSVKRSTRCKTAVQTVISEQQKPQKCISVCLNPLRKIIRFQKQRLIPCRLTDTNGNFFILPNDIFNERMNPRDFIVYSYLKRCCDPKQQCFPSIKNIAENCSISSVTATTAIKNLSDNGYIDIAHRYDGNGVG